MSAAQMKGLFKLGLISARQTSRVLGPEAAANIWAPEKWETLGSQLATSKHFKSSTALRAMCQQVVEAAVPPSTAVAEKTGGRNQTGSKAVKRKAITPGTDGSGQGRPKKTKRKKTDKS